MANEISINLVTKYGSTFEKKMREGTLVFGKGLCKFNFTGANTIKTLTAITQTPNDYNPQAEGSRFGALAEVEDAVNTYTLQYSKSNNMSIDKQYNTERKMLFRAFELMKDEIEEQYHPMMDKHALAVYAGTTGIGKSVDGELTGSTVYGAFTAARKDLVNAHAFKSGKNCVAWVATTVYNDAILDCDKFKDLEKVGTKAVVDGACGKLAGFSVIEVPDEYMPENVNIVFANLKVLANPITIETLRILNQHPDVDGSVLQPHMRYGCFVQNQNVGGVHVSLVEAASE